VHAGLARVNNPERGRKIIGARTRQYPKQVHRIEVDFVPGAARHADPVCAKVSAEAAGAGGGLIVPDIKHEIVLDDVIVSPTQINSARSKGLGIIVSDATDLIFLDCVGALANSTDCPNTDTSIGVAGVVRNPAFHVD